jgi:predicted nucleic acid-binding protein
MPGPGIVVDTSVFVAALRSRYGAAYHLMLTGKQRFEINLSVPLVLEYEEVAKRQAEDLGLEAQDIEAIIGYLCSVAVAHRIYYLWRPFLPDSER